MRYLNYRPANLFKRTIAFWIDYTPIRMGFYIISMAVYGVSPLPEEAMTPAAYIASARASLWTSGCATMLWLVYCIIGELSPWRGTYGKKVMGICVQSVRGGRLTFGQVIGRNAAKILSMPLCSLGCLAAFVTYGNRAWHDSLSGTAVAERR